MRNYRTFESDPYLDEVELDKWYEKMANQGGWYLVQFLGRHEVGPEAFRSYRAKAIFVRILPSEGRVL